MLSLSKAAKDYYLQKLGEISPREDYYLRGGQASGVWRGSGATDQNLKGTVTSEGLVRLFDGEHPATGEQLGRRLRKDTVPTSAERKPRLRSPLTPGPPS